MLNILPKDLDTASKNLYTAVELFREHLPVMELEDSESYVHPDDTLQAGL